MENQGKYFPNVAFVTLSYYSEISSLTLLKPHECEL